MNDTGNEMDSTFCSHSVQPSSRERCQGPPCGQWRTGHWTEVNVLTQIITMKRSHCKSYLQATLVIITTMLSTSNSCD